MTSSIYRIESCPIPDGKTHHHEGVDTLVDVMGNHGVKLCQTEQESLLGGRDGLLARDDVILLKVNAQWKYRGCTNSDVEVSQKFQPLGGIALKFEKSFS